MQRLSPNFFVVGAAKAATTSLYNYLSQHPQIFLPQQKELKYMSSMPRYMGPGDIENVKGRPATLDDYLSHFKASEKHLAKGDVSPDYLYFYDNSIRNIKEICGSDVKIVIMLRNPVDRTYSQYLHLVKKGDEALSFSEALAAEKQRERENWRWAWQYRKSSLYYRAVKAYVDSFEHVKIIITEEFVKETDKAIDEIEDFLGVDRLKLHVNKIHNEGVYSTTLLRAANQKCLRRLLLPIFKIPGIKKTKSCIVRFINSYSKQRSGVSVYERKMLEEYFDRDVRQLENLLGRKLDIWFK